MPTIDQIREHCRIDGTEDDAYLAHLLEVALVWLEKRIGDVPDPLPAPLRHVILMMILHWYDNRESETLAVPYAAEAMLSLYRPVRSRF